MERAFLKHCNDNNLQGVNDCLKDFNETLSKGLMTNDCLKDFNETQSKGLMIACDYGNSDIVSRLVQVSGLDINYENESGYTAAHLASFAGHTECVRILAETGRVDWNWTSIVGETPLCDALREDHSDIVDIIVQQPNIDYNVKTVLYGTLGQVAVWRGYVKCVEILAAQERCQCWNVPDWRGDTPIMWALKRDKTEIVEILLRCPRVDVSCRDREGWSLVFRAIQRNKLGEKMSRC